MVGLRQKLSLGFGGLLLIILIIGIQSIIHLTKLGESIDVILRENYRSVIACQQMKEALERMDSGILFELLGYTQKGDELIRKNELVFEMALQVELITSPFQEKGKRHFISRIFLADTKQRLRVWRIRGSRSLSGAMPILLSYSHYSYRLRTRPARSSG